MKITWDEKKRKQVLKDHRIDFAKIADVFEDPFSIVDEDLRHTIEQRWITIARSSKYGLIVVVYTFRNDEIRLITARRAERWMVTLYEKQRNRP